MRVNGGLNHMAFPVNKGSCRKSECSGVYVVGWCFLFAYRYIEERASGVAKAHVFVRSPPACSKRCREIV